VFTFKSQAAERRPLKMRTLRSFETSGTTRPTTWLSHRGRTEPFETSLCETQISNCWTWFILTLHESAGTRDRKTLLTRCGSFQPPILINTIFTVYIQMEHRRNMQFGDSKENKAVVTSTPLSSFRNVYFRIKYDQMSSNKRTC
jgi:hypothetical protein